MLIMSFAALLLVIAVICIFSYECGHYDGMRCNCAPDQSFWRKWFNVQRVRDKGELTRCKD